MILGRLSDSVDEQVIAPFFIILRVANRSLLTTDVALSRKLELEDKLSPLRVAVGPPLENYLSSMNVHEETSGMFGIEFETTVDVHRDDC